MSQWLAKLEFPGHLDGSLEGWFREILSHYLSWTLGLIHLSSPEKQWFDVGQQLPSCQLPVDHECTK